MVFHLKHISQLQLSPGNEAFVDPVLIFQLSPGSEALVDPHSHKLLNLVATSE
jgi:hypothetical protein